MSWAESVQLSSELSTCTEKLQWDLLFAFLLVLAGLISYMAPSPTCEEYLLSKMILVSFSRVICAAPFSCLFKLTTVDQISKPNSSQGIFSSEIMFFLHIQEWDSDLLQGQWLPAGDKFIVNAWFELSMLTGWSVYLGLPLQFSTP